MRFCSFILLFILTANLRAQDTLSPYHISAELLGVTDIYSLNVEYRITPHYLIETGISWLPGTWQLNGENDRSFLFVPLMVSRQFSKAKICTEISLGLNQQITLHKNAGSLIESSPQIGFGLRYFVSQSLFFKANLYTKSPYFFAADKYEVYVYKSPSWLIWPGFSIGWRI